MNKIRTIQDIETIEQIPLAERGLPSSTYEMLQQGAAIHPDQPALHFFLQGNAYDQAVTFTFRELMAQIHRAANAFTELGIRPGRTVSMILPNLPETHFTIWGGEAAGIVNPINPLLEPAQIRDILQAAEARVLVTLAPFPGVDIWEKVEAIRESVPTLETILQVDLADYLPPAMAAAIRASRPPVDQGGPQRILDFKQALADQPDDRLVSGRTFQPDDIASYFHTGGTTGTPKLAQHTHFNEVYDAWASLFSLEVGPGTVFFCGLPLFHVNGVIVTGLIPWSQGATVVLGTPQGYRGEGVIPNFWKMVEHYRVNFFSGVPTVYSGLLQVPIGQSDVSSLQFAICGAAPMPVEVFQEFEKRTGIRILEGYGLTEGTCVSSVNPPEGERRIGSIGFRLPYQEMKALRLDEEGVYQGECAADEIGVIAIRGANVFPGYREERHNQGIWIDSGDGQGPWLNTGDLGRQDPEGYFWLTGRRKELIIRGGHNIDPKLIEDPLHQHPAVALVAAVGRPDPRVGELPVAYVQLQPGASATEEELLAFARERIPERAAVPKAIRLVEALPVTAVGKIFKPRLVWQEVQDVYGEEVAAVEGVAQVQVTVGPDKLHGTLARIQVTPGPGADPAALRARIDAALGRYTVHYQVEFV